MEISEVEQYKKVPVLRQQQPQITHVTPLQAAGKLYKLEEISTLPISSFKGGASFSCIAKVEALLPSNKWYYKVCKSCGEGYNNNSNTTRCSCPLLDPKPMYKFSLKVTDDIASMETIAFSFVVEDLLEQTAMQASQNMKIDASDHAIALEKAIGKKRLFSIGMNPKYFSRFSINHVLKKSYKIHGDNSQNSIQENITATSEEFSTPQTVTPPTVLPRENTSDSAVDDLLSVSTPAAAPPKQTEDKSKTKRQLDFDNDNDVNKLRKPRTEEKASSEDSK
ncbi:uncharacterized protein LOC100843999 [Brachypodium distachyon]|uniref:uncharacterized protein LOC100843999 n=1 Tax=Brachypodium distachyon TaxID=15368 RepID=UPI00071C6A76|nr:uncharacterized protein LOC100843999 [Brachypodium distachyon]XP_014757361.1 uncharacterized protein LOC100843999 [Brachypodium distachyon]XP_014757362.1 uncharacterized protein LOC100843999 [Brachypodium distachyon]XP_014757363.1 uncharacterized protein LOC100843999 [Brachypodium distachyon]XP_014757365.1 uncharacterized protein LOC100843999 [Brachypodium distachyon]XP_014757366.1 uncharacterized protein LOC100843999 [Brachypodium distachyon]XP_024310640.1 uncharacterized protein LOC10084|eukprot:XP_010237680.2 uncharacterized protein LOC100843999 [Brachypodium distachyon]